MSAARVALTGTALGTAGAGRWAGWRSWLSWLLTLVVAVPALWPVATHQFLETDDSRMHLNRLVGFTALLSQGVLYPRLYPDLASGYGYPLGLFYPPLSLYVGGVPLLLGGDATVGLRFAYATALVVAALGAFALGRAVSGCLAGGLLASAMLTYAPYVLALVYRRGALAELWGVALAPWVFWALWRWPGGRAGLLVAALALAGVLLAHNLVALIIWPLAAAWWVLRQGAQGCVGRSLLRGGLPFLAAAALAAPYWLPATVLADTVSLDRFRDAPLRHLTPPLALIDWSLLARYERFQLGALQLTVALAGVAVALCLRSQRGLTLFGLGSAILLVLLTATPAAPLWDALPFLDPLQFPFRLMGPVALLLALAALPLSRAGLPLASGATLLLATAALPALPVPARPIDPAWLTTAGVARWEFVDRSVGTTIAREYLPRGVATSWRYPADGFFGPAPNSGEPLARVHVLQAEPLRWELIVEAPAPTVIRFHTFALPGWQASIDGRAASLSESGRLRLLTLEVPAGQHQVQLWYGETPAGVLGLGLAALALLLLIGRAWSFPALRPWLAFALLLVVGEGALLLARPAAPGTPLAPAEFAGIRLAGGVVAPRNGQEIGVTLVWQAVTPGQDHPLGVRVRPLNGGPGAEHRGRPLWGTASPAWWWRNELVRDVRTLRLPPGATPGRWVVEAIAGDDARVVGEFSVDTPVPPREQPPERASWDGVAVSAARLLSDRFLQPGAVIQAEISWVAIAPPGDDYALFASLIDPSGRPVARDIRDPRNGLGPTALWQPGDGVTIRYQLSLPADALPGRYLVQAGLAPFRTWPGEPNVRGLTLLPPLVLREPPEAIALREELHLSFEGIIELVGYDLLDEGDILLLRWRALTAPRRDYTVFVHLLDESGHLVGQVDSPPRQGGYPTSLWEPGDQVTDRVTLPEAEGIWTVRIGLYDAQTGRRLLTPRGDAVDLPFRP